MSSVIIAGDTSGTVTLAAPSVAGTTTLTLPSTSGTIVTSASSLTASQLPTGSIIQIVQGQMSTQVSTTSTTFVSATLNASITPSSSSNKILVMVSGPGGSNTSGGITYYTIYRDATNIIPATFSGYNYSSAMLYAPVTINYLDSPATTSSTTYTVYFKTSAVSSVLLSAGGGTSTITLMEVKA
jgi:hypothetical protein